MREKTNNGQRQVHSSRAEAVTNKLSELLEVDVSYPGWEHQTAEQKAFYVRGFAWFRDQVIHGKMGITDCGAFIPQMKAILNSRSSWTALPFNWNEQFSSRQFIDAASPVRRLTPKFRKAVEVITLCEAIAQHFHDQDARSPAPEEVFEHMRIEPAVSYIHGFDRNVLDALTPDQMSTLRRWTGQRSPTVFSDMAEGRTVTHKLALWTLNYLNSQVPGAKVGEVDFKFARNALYSPSQHENIDAKESDLPPEALKSLRRSQS